MGRNLKSLCERISSIRNQATLTKGPHMKIDLSFWTNSSTRRKRFYTAVFVLVIAVVITVLGSFLPVSHSDAVTISNQVNQTVNAHKSNGTLTEYIFLNNFELCLLMFIPFAGPIIGMGILLNTGYALGAIASVQGYPVFVALLTEFITPVFWLEFIAYSTAMAASIWLSRRLLQERWRELKNTAIQIGICALILVVSAAIEAWLISLGF